MQGLMLDCDPLEWEALERLPAVADVAQQPPPCWLALDEVCDPVSTPIQGFRHQQMYP